MPSPPESPSSSRLLELLDAFPGRRIALYADLVVDRFIRGTPKRISREAPVLILHQDSEEVVPGGGANAVLNVRALGGSPQPVGVVGDDDNGRALLGRFEAEGIAVGGILTRPGTRTPSKTRILAGARHAIKQQIVRFDSDDEVALGDDDRNGLAGRLRAAADGAEALIVSDYGQGGVEPGLVPTGGTCPVLADSRYRLPDFAGIDGATPNEEELDVLEPGEAEAAPERAGRLRQRLGATFVLLTRGSGGMVLSTSAGAVAIPVHGTDQVADVTGAGDTVIGTFALATAAGADPLEAALLANYAGGVVVMKLGTATASADELRTAIRSDPRPREELRWVGS
ncbi:MAG: PfkB family carbohydrate kinase [Thermoanaerobaculia bacterium]|nr:PfkB family carbohydrate kinase [Thermoanaerobaculia bacterium]